MGQGDALPLPRSVSNSPWHLSSHSPDVNYEELARCTDDFNGAQCKAVCVEAVSGGVRWVSGCFLPPSLDRAGLFGQWRLLRVEADQAMTPGSQARGAGRHP